MQGAMMLKNETLRLPADGADHRRRFLLVVAAVQTGSAPVDAPLAGPQGR